MSAPDPSTWQATLEECEATGRTLSGFGLSNRVARRRAVEELKALAKVLCVHCAAGVEFVRLRDEIGKWDGHMHNPSDLVDCDALHVHSRIAAIESEEA